MTTHIHRTGNGTAGTDTARSDLLDVSQVAEKLNCSPRSVYRLSDGGRMPKPIKLGALVRWRADELRAWISEGCPPVRHISTRNATAPRKGGAR